jgi:hypothetical protein
MKPIGLHFEEARPSWTRRMWGAAPRGPQLAAAGVLAAAAAVGVAAAWETSVARSGAEDAGRAFASADRAGAVARGQSAPRTARATPAERDGGARIAAQLNTPWSELLDALEQATPDSVALVAIEPDAGQRSVRLQVEGKTLDALLAYANDLGTVPLFSSVALTKHETNEQDANRPVRLGIELRLRPRPLPAPDGRAP